MPIAHEILAVLPLTALMSATALGASITGTITGPDGRPFMGAFVAAENPQSRMTVNVLSDAQGRYRISNLPGATYTVRIEVVGYTSEPRGSVALAVDATASLDFALKKTQVRWSDLSTYQGRQLLPKTKDHDLSYKDSFFHQLLPVLPLLPEADGDAIARSRRLAYARALHERYHAGRPPPEQCHG